MICTIYENIYSNKPLYITIDTALERIATGKSKQKVEEIRAALDKGRADSLKKNLPSVCFSGKFGAPVAIKDNGGRTSLRSRLDENLLQHSGFLVLDFDEMSDLRDRQTEIISHPFVYACWVSPRNNGLKALVKIADGGKHRLHFAALKEIFPDADRSGVNESRVCYESYDPDIYINKNATPFTKILERTVIEQKQTVSDKTDVFNKLLVWLTNRGDAFKTGERNMFIYKLASACCRFGIAKDETTRLINNRFLINDTTFALREAEITINSAYKKNVSGSAVFERDVLVDSVHRGEVVIDADIFNEEIRAKDVIFGEDVKDKALEIYRNGYAKVDGIGCEIDDFYKMKRGEITCLSGIGNYGKSSWLAWKLLMRIVKYGEKFALFSPESNPPEEFYHDYVETLLGSPATPDYQRRPSEAKYQEAYDYISKHLFYVYPKEIAPTPEYIKERFLELIIKEGVSGCIIDPFNQLSNDYRSAGGRSDKYLETFLSDCTRFAQMNNVYFVIVAHPHKMKKEQDGNYPCPDVFDLADGAMWNNKMDNILIYHRPNHQKDPQSTLCELHSKKIRRQKQVGKKGVVQFEYLRQHRRFFFNGGDPLQKILNEKEEKVKQEINFGGGWKPVGEGF